MAADVRLGAAESVKQDLDDPRLYGVTIPLEQLPMRDPDRWLNAWAVAHARQPGVDFGVERQGPTTVKIHIRAREERLPSLVGILQDLVRQANEDYGDPGAERERQREQRQSAADTKAEAERRVLEQVNSMLG
jgi:hypothetical protein